MKGLYLTCRVRRLLGLLLLLLSLLLQRLLPQRCRHVITAQLRKEEIQDPINNTEHAHTFIFSLLDAVADTH